MLEQDNYELVSAFGKTKEAQQRYEFYTLATIPFLSQLSFTLGERLALQKNQLQSAASFKRTNEANANTLGFQYDLNKDWQFYLRRAESYRFPKAEEEASATDITGLNTQKGVSYELGAQFHSDKYLLKADIFQLNLRNEIAFDPLQTPQNPFGSNTNLTPTKRKGASLNLDYQVNETTTVYGLYQYVNAQFSTGIYAGKRIPLVAESLFKGKVQYHYFPDWNFSVESSYTGSEYPDNDNLNVSGKLGGYTLINFHVEYTYRHLLASFALNNIFNKYYYIYSVYQNNPVEQFFYPAAGRNFMVNLRYDLE
jgi:iron complex outermembrane receptor protein